MTQRTSGGPTNGGRPRVYVAFDDTDNLGADRGTGKVGRWFADDLPAGVHPWAVVRQQLLVHPDVPYTSHNSSAVCVLEVDASLWPATPSLGDGVLAELVERACRHVERYQLPGSDPGVCVAWEGGPALDALTAFGRRAAVEVVTQAAARAAAEGAHLSGHGGTDDGIIGAAAGVGLTAEGWHGRLIEYRVALRDFPTPCPWATSRRRGSPSSPWTATRPFRVPTRWSRPGTGCGRGCSAGARSCRSSATTVPGSRWRRAR